MPNTQGAKAQLSRAPERTEDIGCQAIPWGGGVRTFCFYIEDDRYSVPTLTFVTARDEVRAREIARGQLGASSHHLAVEVWEDERLLFRVGRKGT